MAVNQPLITGNQAEDSWKLEVTNQLNNEEARVNSLASQIGTTNNTGSIALGGNNIFTGNNTFEGVTTFSQPYLDVTKSNNQTFGLATSNITFNDTPQTVVDDGITLSTNDEIFTINIAGLYLINLVLAFSNPPTGFVLGLNTSTSAYSASSGTNVGSIIHRTYLERYNRGNTVRITGSGNGTIASSGSRIQFLKIG